ncbi:MAG: hypothetical protein GY757_27140 [bacterium]|nr:hypothetical protein [bacterium]
MPKIADSANKMIYRKPKRIFEKSGSVDPEASYFSPLENVVNADNLDMKTMVDQGRYFSIFAPRQSGKTTFLEHFCEELQKDVTYIAIILNFQKYRDLDKERFYARIQKKLYKQLIHRLTFLECNKLDEITAYLQSHPLTDHISFGDLFEELNNILEFTKIVIFIDEFDGIPLKELENFLNTVRDLYLEYKKIRPKALYSIGLVGIRNITKLIVGGVSPFNIADQVDLPPFSLKNVSALYAQYTKETNQPFTNNAVKKVFKETGGQPWLVNRLGTILTINLKPGTVEPIDEQDVDNAIQILLKERNVHFDNLDEKAKHYKETFVEIVFDGVEYNPGDDAQTWLEQFGLIKNKDGKAEAANSIYSTRYIKTFFAEVTDGCLSPQVYTLPGGKLDMERVLLDFDRYIAQIGVRAFYESKKPYERTGQFLLTAWLYRFVNDGGGDLRYEPLTGLGRIDILLSYKNRKYIIETKINHRKSITNIRKQGIRQVADKYLATESADEGYLVIFDTGTPAGTVKKPKTHTREGKRVNCFIIGIGYREK